MNAGSADGDRAASEPTAVATAADDTDTDADTGTDADGGNRSLVAELGRRLEAVRADPRQRAVAIALTTVIGLALAWLHWFGLVLAGALVGLVSASPWRALATAAGFGLVALGLFVVSLGGATATVLEMRPVVYLTVGSAIGLPMLGSLVRGLV
ncbi:hypothetical protein [Natrialba asiatica]|uniref:Uncharacterized protein n=1 Tax=Natrialba asiatica (strain ATCC 700177 / DSM 12278 / JCM 9576 / FERM P-10747 / NBRC 102637 / 172P1) TaxID=29540 RepID=M0APU7_NATA1|nr:hypothetical protein [Natrialba asiatica]ELZ00357.1 hypothetical protein C481_11944 [Natrialba asiatica DSM 12278]